MTVGNMTPSPEISADVPERSAAARNVSERTIWAGLTFALLLHAAFFISIGRSAQRVLGAPDGSNDPISVSLITESEYKSQTTTPAAEPPPAAPAPPTPPEAAPSPPPPPPPAAVAPPQPAPQPETPPPNVEPQKVEQPPPDVLQKGTLLPELEKERPDLLTPPKPQPPAKQQAAAKPSEAAPAKKPTTQQRTSKLDLSPPPTFDGSAGAGEAAFARPPGITKSGWNDAFARDVIRALQMTMPQLRALGRVTIRILLTDSGNVSDVQLLRPSSDSNLNQLVVFAARQTSYPFPPAGATVADRTFMVTYIYE